MSPVGWRSRPKACLLGVSGVAGVGLLGLLRSPARGKPARHDEPACHDGRSGRSRGAGAVNVERGLVPRWGAKPPQSLLARCVWRNWVGLLGLLRSPARGKPARHTKPACHSKPARHNGPSCAVRRGTWQPSGAVPLPFAPVHGLPYRYAVRRARLAPTDCESPPDCDPPPAPPVLALRWR